MSPEMLSILVLFGLFFLLMFLSVPVSFSIGIATVATILITMPFDTALFVTAQKMISALDSFALLALRRHRHGLGGHHHGLGRLFDKLRHAVHSLGSDHVCKSPEAAQTWRPACLTRCRQWARLSPDPGADRQLP